MAAVREIAGKLAGKARQFAATRRARQALLCLLAVSALSAAGWLVASSPEPPRKAEAQRRPTEGRMLRLGPACEQDNRPDSPLSSGQVSAHDPQTDSGVAGFERLVCENDIWRTQAQNDKRWQAAKMASLSALVSEFPAVASATVIFDPGSPRKLGSSAIPPSAAVKVSLGRDVEMTGELVTAIADLICGAIAGMDGQNVRIVDDAGFSYLSGRGESGFAGSSKLAENRTRAIEKEHADRVRRLLGYIEGLIVAVNVDASGPEGEDFSVLVAVPRTHLVTALRGRCQQGCLAEELDAVAEPYLSRIQQSVTHLLGLDDASAVKVDWYYDATSPRGGFAQSLTQTHEQPSVRIGGSAEAVLMCSIGLCWFVAVGTLVCKRIISGLQRRRRGRLGHTEAASDQKPAPDEADQTPLADPFEHLGGFPVEKLGAVLNGESAQTITLVLTHLAPAKAAALLSTFEGKTQVEIAKRLASRKVVDEVVAVEVAEELSLRLSDRQNSNPADSDGAGKVADILHHAGYHTERMVMEAISSDSPDLADSIRDRMFAFEDISKLSVDELRPAMSLVESDELAIALRTAGRELTKRIFSALSGDKVKQVKQRTEAIGPVRLSDVESAQRQIVNAIHRVRYGRYVSERQSVRAETS